MSAEDAFEECVLENGIRIIHHSIISKVTYCGYAIGVGTRNEKKEESGLAHFVEHLLFKGTQKRKPFQILNRLSNVGGDIDAYTNKEETMVYATVLNEDFERACDLLTDMVFHSIFPQVEIEKEANIILDEIKLYKDTPSELIYDEFENLIFKGHSLAKNILGDKKHVKNFNTAAAKSFFQQHYYPGNVVFFVYGNQKFTKILHLINKYTRDLSTFTIPQQYHDNSLNYRPQYVEIDKHTHQSHVIIGCPGYKAYDKNSAGMYMLSNILGGSSMNSRLNLSLRERSALVYTVESGITTYTDAGVFYIYFGSDVVDVGKCIELIYSELKRLRSKKLSTLQLSTLKKQIIGQLYISNENSENNALEMAKTFLHYQRYDTMKQIINRIESLTSEELITIANDKLDEKKFTTLVFR